MKSTPAPWGTSATGSASRDINLSALAVAALAGIILNAIFPGKDYDFSKQSVADVKSTKDNKAEAKAE